MTTAQVIHAADLHPSLEVKDGKVQLNGEAVYGAMKADNLHITVHENKPSDMYIDANSIDGGVNNNNTLTFEELKAEFERLKAANPLAGRISIQSGGASWTFTKTATGEWVFGTTFYHGGVGGVTEGYGTVVNDPANPLFVKKDGTPVSALETLYTYNLQAARLMRMVVGAKATYKFVAPAKLRSSEITADVKLSGYVQGSLKVNILYANGSTFDGRARPYNNAWYMGDVIDQTLPVSEITVEVDAQTLEECGKLPTNFSRDFATGAEYHRTSPDYALGTPYLTYSFWGSYCHNTAMSAKFHLPEEGCVDITPDCTITANIAEAAGFPLSNVRDNDPATAYKAATTGNSLTFTLQRVDTSPKVFRHVDVTLQLELGSEASFESLSRVAVATSRNSATAGATSNTRDFTGIDSTKVDANGNITLRFMAGLANTYPDVTDKMTIALTKTVAGNFKVAGIKVFGHAPTAG